MAEQESSRGKARRNPEARRGQPAEWKPRFEFRREERPEPENRLPDLTQTNFQVIPLERMDWIVIPPEPGKGGGTFQIFTEKILEHIGVTEEEIRKTAEQFGIYDFVLFRAVFAAAAAEAKKSEDYALSWNDGPEFGLTHEQFRLIREADRLSGELEHVLRELAARAAERRRKSAFTMFAERRQAKQLLRALSKYGEHISEFCVIECTLPSKRPVDGRSRRVVAVLASAWSKLAGEALTPWNASFYKLVDSVCRSVGIISPPRQQSVANWLKDKLPEGGHQKKSEAGND